MTERKPKKKILIITGRYLPGYKDGGPVRSVVNLTDYLGDEFEFRILTCDRDHGDTKAYSNIKVYEWNQVRKAKVYYVPPKGFKFSVIKTLAAEVDLVYVCGCFSDYAIHTLILNKMGKIKKPVVVASMGLFSPMEFRLKYKKKKLFTEAFNTLGMFKNIYWSATSEMEISEILQQVKGKRQQFYIAEDLPRMVDSHPISKGKKEGILEVVWISRIVPKKNLLGAIKVLHKTKEKMNFTIYGPIQEEEYWKKCQEELEKLPKNVKWKYAGNIDSELVVTTLKKHHVFLFPTLGENYGHVIQEALSAGCACLLSDQTPWKDLEDYGVGYVFRVKELDKFAYILDKYARLNQAEMQKIVDASQHYAIENSNEKAKNTGYRQIFYSLCNERIRRYGGSMKNILYLNNFITEKVLASRENKNFYSQSANNKIMGLIESLTSTSCTVTVLSSGLVNNKSGRLYSEVEETIGKIKIITCTIRDIPFMNTLSSIIHMYQKIKRLNKEKKMDHIIFYNFKPEVAWAALLAKTFLNIPITVEYEDGYADVQNVKGIKRKIFLLTEKVVSKKVDSAILVSSRLSDLFKQPKVIVRGVVNQKFYEECKQYKKQPNNKYTILYSGGLGHARGVDVLLKSLAYLDIDCVVQITGKGTLNYCDDRIDFKGFLEYDEVQKLMMQADLLVQCQLVNEAFACASFPSKIFEYIATGNRIVSSNMEEVIDFAGDNFIYYEDDSPKALAEAIERAYHNRDKDLEGLHVLCSDNLPAAVGRRIMAIL